MNNTIKKIIKRIASADITRGVNLLGDEVADILFKKDCMAISIGVAGRGVEILFGSHVSQIERQEALLLFTELTVTLNILEKKQMIYIVEDSIGDGVFFYQNKTRFDKGQRPSTYDIGDHQEVTFHEDCPMILKQNGDPVLTSVAVESSIALSLKHFLCSRILPTQALIIYQRQGFRTKEELYTKKGMRYSVIAIAIALFSPVLSLFIANKYGVTHIEREQIDTLIQTIKAVHSDSEAAPVNNSDTSTQYPINNTSYDAKKQI